MMIAFGFAIPNELVLSGSKRNQCALSVGIDKSFFFVSQTILPQMFSY